jgi:hypothetical protein
MVWSKIVGLFKQLDSHLSDAVYLHGCYLIGQEETFSHDREHEAKDHARERSNAGGVQARSVTRSGRAGSVVGIHEVHLAG